MSSILRVPAAFMALGLVSVFVACAESEDVAPPREDLDAGTLPAVDGAASEGGPDGEAGVSPRECSDDGYCHTVLPKNQTLRGVWGDGQGAVWAVSNQGAILRWDGKVWAVHVSGLGPLTTVWGSGPTDLWVGGDNGLFHGTGTSPAALAFAPSTTPSGSVVSIWGSSAADVWAVLVVPDDGESPRSRVLHYAAGGGWVADPVSTSAPEIRFSRVWGSAATGVWLAGTTLDPDVFLEMGTVYRRAPGGAPTFEALTLPGHPEPFDEFDVLGEVTSVAMSSDTNMLVHARTSGGAAIFVRGTSPDGGQTFTWSSELDGTYEDPATNAISAVSPNDAWTAGEYGRIRRWNGTEWIDAAITVTRYPVIAPFYGTWAKGPGDVWFVGEDIALHLDPAKKP